MPSGQAHTTWFPELKEIIKKKWDIKYSMSKQFELVEELNQKLNRIRKDGNIQPPMIWCSNCQERHQGAFMKVSIMSMHFALEREGICTHTEFLKLKREWNKYAKSEGVNVYGEKKEKKHESRTFCKSYSHTRLTH